MSKEWGYQCWQPWNWIAHSSAEWKTVLLFLFFTFIYFLKLYFYFYNFCFLFLFCFCFWYSAQRISDTDVVMLVTAPIRETISLHRLLESLCTSCSTSVISSAPPFSKARKMSVTGIRIDSLLHSLKELQNGNHRKYTDNSRPRVRFFSGTSWHFSVLDFFLIFSFFLGGDRGHKLLDSMQTLPLWFTYN